MIFKGGPDPMSTSLDPHLVQPFCVLKVHMSNFLNHDVYMFLRIIFISASSADPDEMSPYVTFHLGLHCLPKYLFSGIQNEKG